MVSGINLGQGYDKYNSKMDPSDFSEYPGLNDIGGYVNSPCENDSFHRSNEINTENKTTTMEKVALGLSLVIGAFATYKIGKAGINLFKKVGKGIKSGASFVAKKVKPEAKPPKEKIEPHF